jgi:hypothetical protein
MDADRFAFRPEFSMTTYVDATAKKKRMPGIVPLHGEEGIEGMRKAGALTAQVLDLLAPMVQPGVPTARIDRFVYASDWAGGLAELEGVLQYAPESYWRIFEDELGEARLERLFTNLAPYW